MYERPDLPKAGGQSRIREALEPEVDVLGDGRRTLEGRGRQSDNEEPNVALHQRGEEREFPIAEWRWRVHG